MWLLIIFLILAFIFLLLMISPLQINLRYALDKGGIEAPDGVISVSSPGTGAEIKMFWGIIHFHIRLSSASLGYRALKPVFKLRAKLAGRSKTMAKEQTRITPEQARKLYDQAIKLYQATLPANKYLLEGVTVNKFSWRTGISLLEASQTGIAVGGLWMLKSNLSAQLYRMIKRPAPMPELDIQPIFKNQFILWVRINLNISIRMSRMVTAGLLAAWLYIKKPKTKR